MGVLNVTPDSFSDGGLFINPAKAVQHAFVMEREGADILDIGGESTRPGSEAISVEEEIRRVLPVLEGLRGKICIPISIDTRRSEVAEAAISAGAEIVNDVTGLRCDPVLARVAAKHRAAIILMHMRGQPRTMQKTPFARNVVRDVMTGLRRSLGIARKSGITRTKIILDPGIGFGKSFAQNYELLARLPELARLGHPLLIGTSRKTFLGNTLDNAAPEARLWGTAATVAASILGGAHIVRVHDVAEMIEVARVSDAVLAANSRRR